MAERFVRDEKKTFPFTWLMIGGVFALSSVWAVYAELVTRVPWQEHQGAFYELELRLAEQAYAQAEAEWAKLSAEGELKQKIDRRAELDAQMADPASEYKKAKNRLAELDKEYRDAETRKTFGASDLDEGYYYRNLAEYDRDAASNAVRDAYRAAYPDDEARRNAPDALYADPPPPPRGDGVTAPMHHLHKEVARHEAHIGKLEGALQSEPNADVVRALRRSVNAERAVVAKLQNEIVHQARLDEAVGSMMRIEGPAEPRVTETDPAARVVALKAAQEQVCQGKEDTRACIRWLRLGPIDAEHKLLTIAISKARRPVEDAKLRLDTARRKAEPTLDFDNLMGSLVGPFQIEQIVTSWMAHERDVDIQQVDRCNTCHMGVNKPFYSAASTPEPFRTHPRRDKLLAAHPVERFGCTSCHQGQGRATDDLAHSSWRLHEHHGRERWHYDGDHYWEDPLLPVGSLSKIVIDGANDELSVSIAKRCYKKPDGDWSGCAWTPIKLDHGVLAGETELWAALQTRLAAALSEQAAYAGKWHVVVRKVDNRVSIGLEQNDPTEALAADATPSFAVQFTKPGLATLLGFGPIDALAPRSLAQMYTAPEPPVQPIRADRAEASPRWDEAGRYLPPQGAAGLQVPDEMRNRFIQALPEVEAGCLRCHKQDADLAMRSSGATFVTSKLARQKAEVELKADPAAYEAAHGSMELPEVAADPRDELSQAPTFDRGRWLFRQLNCTGCHLLDGYEGNRNAGPQLDDVSAKVTPEWLLTWLRYPRGWRAKTSMPNLWPAPLDPASKLPYAEGTPEHTRWQETRTAETVAVAAYLWDRSEAPEGRAGAGPGAKALKAKVEGYASRPEAAGATAELGAQVFEAYGCQGCHARHEGDVATEKLPDAWRQRERDLAPTLSNLGAKTTADWIAYWVEDPARYWHGTSMPKLRLSPKEAASLGLYLTSDALKSKPVAAAPVAAEEVSLVTDAARRQELVPCEAAAGAKLSRVECGERVIARQGCFGCHQIDGFETRAPIGPELAGFAKKDITTLDFGYAIADHHLQTTETFATLKLDAPRIYARDRIELYMGDFDLSQEEIRALVVFLKGTVVDVPNDAFDPMAKPEYAEVVKGRQLVNDLNCRGCHVIEGRGADIDGFRQKLLTQNAQLRAPYLDGEGARVQPEWLFSFLRNPDANGIRPWLHPEWAWGDDVPDDKRALRMPTFNLSSEQWTQIVRYFAAWDEQPYPYVVPQTAELDNKQRLFALKHMNSTQHANCMQCHFHGEFPVEMGRSKLADMAPNFDLVRKRLRPEWVKAWLLKPQNFMPYTKMTAFWAVTERPAAAQYWPGETDPFLSPAVKWDLVPGFESLTSEQQATLVRDFLFNIPDGVASFPAVGQEESSPLYDPSLLNKAVAKPEEAEPAPGEAPLPPGEQPGG